MILLDYVINLAIFSLMVSTPLVIRSLINYRPLKNFRLWGSIYGGLVSVILVILTIHHEGYSYDIRYVPVILVYSYFGPLAGIVTGLFALCARLYSAGNWFPAITGWLIIMLSFTFIHFYIKRLSRVKKTVIIFGVYVIIYVITVPLLFNVIRDNPLFHLQYLLFIMFGVVIGILLIESYMKLFRIIRENKQMQNILEESEANYRLIAENTSDLILVLDKSAKIKYYSPSHQKVLGYKESEFSRDKLKSIVHPDDVEIFTHKVQIMFEEVTPNTIDVRLKHKDGHWVQFESRCMPVLGESQTVDHIVIISRDISERLKSEELLLQSEKLSIVGELAAGVAHEIRNPLTTIKGFIQLNKVRDDSFEFNDLLLSELERIEAITSELLTLGKPQALKLEDTNVAQVIENTVELLMPQAHMNNIQFNMIFEDSELFITCEKNQIKQVFLNIIKNAIEAMPKGGNIDITLTNGTEHNCVISFQDYGSGIPEEILPRLGEPFYSLKEKGTGLGLMICQKIIKLHHGTITFNSKLGEGTLIEITLPLSEE
ncbi:ATP-binding protein [Bacillus suaedaesalsae]|uniref:histidine kinase n=1 Tax=Bacillus suaedaesalsae TaxID=2810349 RepID=A0ABS2DDT3_9BACI|nr:ATP-binding protein [Bacillus suaedaesalsae]MBM6616612.1 PAS domain S-box protein [Bacillus suaedaesalsae]